MRSKTIRTAAVTVAATALVVTAVAFGDAEGEHAAPPPVRDDVPSLPRAEISGLQHGGLQHGGLQHGGLQHGELQHGGLRAATTQYSHGDPTDEEQWFLELMNRARLDPAAEADRMLVDYDYRRVTQAVNVFLKKRPGVEYTRRENHDAFEALPAAQPFAFVPELITAARNHSEVMRATDEQTHQAASEPALRDRVNATGYAWNRLGESVFAFADDMLHAHAGFAIDWGQPLAGARPATGHRDSLMDLDFVTVGVGVVQDPRRTRPRGSVGPKLITIDFAVPKDAQTRYVTGVVYTDLNGNLMYDPGEGIPGVRIETDVSDFFAISSASGGYAIPVAAGSGQMTVTATGTPGTAGELVGTQQSVITVAGDNVKVDFGPPPEPTPPSFATIAGAMNVPLGDGGLVQTTLVVPQLDADVATIGDVDVILAVRHANRSELTITLIGPTGTEVVLFDGAPGGADLRGTFDTTLRPRESLGALVGSPYQGTWTLRIQDAAGGVLDGVLESWALRVRPEWVRTLFAEPSPLVVKALKVKDSSKPGKDKIILKADLDVGGEILDPALGGTLRLLDASNGEPFLEVDLLAPTAKLTPSAKRASSAKRATPEGATVKTKLSLGTTTSRGSVVVKVSGLDLAGAAPATTRVELAVGGAIVTQDVRVTSGKSTGTATELFFVDSVSSKPSSSGRSTVVKGRFGGTGGPIAVTGVVEVSVGTARYRLDGNDLTVKGTKSVFKSGSGLRKLIVDPASGSFQIKIDAPHDVKVGGVVPVTLRLGTSFFGATSVQPFEKGTKTLY